MMSSNTLGNTDFNPINGVVPPPKGKATLQKDDKLKLAPSQPDKFEKTTASPRKTAEATLTKQAEETPTPVATKQGNPWLLPVAGSVAGLILSGIMFFVGKDLATKEALKVVREKSGQLGDDAEKLGANIAKAIKDAKQPASGEVVGLTKEMTDELQAMLKGDDAKLEGIALVKAGIEHLKKEITVQQTGFEGQLRTALEANGFDANTLKNKNLDELLNLAKTQLQQLEQLKSGIIDSYTADPELDQTVKDPVARLETLGRNFYQQNGVLMAVRALYEQLIPEGQETNAVKQLAAIAQHQDMAKLEKFTAESLTAGCHGSGKLIAKILETKEESPLNKILTEKTDLLNNGQGLLRSEMLEALKNGFDDKGHIYNSGSADKAYQLGFIIKHDSNNTSSTVPTPHTQVMRILSECLTNPTLNSQLTQEERLSVSTYLELLLGHPQVTEDYRKIALQLPEDFALRTKLLNSIFSDNTNYTEVSSHLLEHLNLQQINDSPEAKQALEDSIPQLVADVNQSPKDFEFLEGKKNTLSPSDRILQRALRLALHKPLLEALGNPNLIPLEVSAGRQAEALSPLLETFYNGLKQNEALHVLVNSDVLVHSLEETKRTIYKAISDIWEYAPREDIASFLDNTQHDFEKPLVEGFAEIHFPDSFRSNEGKTTIVEILSKLATLVEDLAETDPKKKAVATLQALHEHLAKIEKLPSPKSISENRSIVLQSLRSLSPNDSLPTENLEPFMEVLSSADLVLALKEKDPERCFLDNVNDFAINAFSGLHIVLANMIDRQREGSPLSEPLSKQIEQLKNATNYLENHLKGISMLDDSFPAEVNQIAQALEVARQTGKPQDVQIVALEQVLPFLKQEFGGIQKAIKAEMSSPA